MPNKHTVEEKIREELNDYAIEGYHDYENDKFLHKGEAIERLTFFIQSELSLQKQEFLALIESKRGKECICYTMMANVACSDCKNRYVNKTLDDILKDISK